MTENFKEFLYSIRAGLVLFLVIFPLYLVAIVLWIPTLGNSATLAYRVWRFFHCGCGERFYGVTHNGIEWLPDDHTRDLGVY